MNTSYDVRVYKIDVYKSRKKNGPNTYWVCWKVDGERFKEPFKHSGLADSYRADLIAAARKGEAFRLDDGLPLSMARRNSVMSWYEFACSFVDMKWPRAAATTRRTNAEAMTAITAAMLSDKRGMPDGKLLRRALNGWGFNTVRRDSEDQPADVTRTLRWLRDHTRNVSTLQDPAVLRSVLDSLTVRLDGKAAAPSVSDRRRKILITAARYAVELGLLNENPIPALRWTPPKTTLVIDDRRVANPLQVRSLLMAIRAQKPSGPRLVAFFGCLYYAGLRPEEAVPLAQQNLLLPPEGWGELRLDTVEPYAGKAWTDSGRNRDRRDQLKQRARGETRPVPCPPELTALLRQHIAQFGTTGDGRLFRGERNGDELPKLTIVRSWQRARRAVFTPDVAATSLAESPYDLRHAAVSTWLNGGVPPTTVAKWAGHSVEVLLSIYAKCLDGTDAAVRRRVEEALGTPETSGRIRED